MFPNKINRFEIKGNISDNERGVVYKAFDPELNKEVAIKMLKARSLYTLTSERKFSEYAKKIAGLHHRAILPLNEFGEEDNNPFFVLPLMVQNLTQYLAQKGKLSPAEAVELFKPIAEGLDYAADQGIVHLEIKPSNILFDTHNHPYLADIGVSQLIDEISSIPAKKTNPNYISPEQTRNRPVDHRSNVYSLSALMIEAITGHTLFEGASDMVTMFKHTSEPPKSPQLWRPDLSSAVANVLLRAVNKNPEKRYPTAIEFIKTLNKAVGGEISPEEILEDSKVSTPDDRFPQYPPSGDTEGFDSLPGPRVSPVTTKRPAIYAILTLSVGLVVCIGLVVFGLIFFAQDTGSNLLETVIPPEPTENISATQTETTSKLRDVDGWNEIIFDDFSDNSNDWLVGNENDQFADITWTIDQKYTWDYTANQGFVWRVWPEMPELETMYVSIDARHLEGSGNQFGIFLRHSENSGEYYYFEVQEDGYFRFSLYYREEWTDLIDSEFAESFIPGGTNKLSVIAEQDHLIFLINDVMVGETFDSTLSKGMAGIIIGLYNQGDHAVTEFDNFLVRSPESPNTKLVPLDSPTQEP